MADEYGFEYHDTVALPPELPEEPETGHGAGEEQDVAPEDSPPGEVLDEPVPENPFNSPAVD